MFTNDFIPMTELQENLSFDKSSWSPGNISLSLFLPFIIHIELKHAKLLKKSLSEATPKV